MYIRNKNHYSSNLDAQDKNFTFGETRTLAACLHFCAHREEKNDKGINKSLLIKC